MKKVIKRKFAKLITKSMFLKEDLVVNRPIYYTHLNTFSCLRTVSHSNPLDGRQVCSAGSIQISLEHISKLKTKVRVLMVIVLIKSTACKII